MPEGFTTELHAELGHRAQLEAPNRSPPSR